MPEDSILPSEDVAPVESAEDADIEQVDDAQEMEQPEEHSAEPQKVDDWENRFKGLQASMQREVETRRQLESELQTYREAQVKQQIEALPEEQQAVALELWRREQQITAREAEMETLKGTMEMAARQWSIHHFSTKYGVPAEDLEDLDTPKQMEIVAQKLSRARRTERKAERKAKGADNFTSAAQVSAPPKKFSKVSDALAYFRSLE